MASSSRSMVGFFRVCPGSTTGFAFNSLASPHRKFGLCHCRDRTFYLRRRCGLLGVNLEKIGPLHVFIVEAARERGLHHHEVGR